MGNSGLCLPSTSLLEILLHLLYSMMGRSHRQGRDESFFCWKRVILPPSFTGGHRYMFNNFKDAMAMHLQEIWVPRPLHNIYLQFSLV
ncbi:uncharacterized protein LOC130727618 isoform X6 [Lotus japonicus]|uniref:uncharacterized protein LOC130727618 isoform X6 n=1 Tax=Lotus japonicus TaxID=34305 RepID=UPI00258AE884|nr:uncharacterized protein LOC130727618 isoform X6 [Lotus japonicus]XP_057434796.1 uncharacterized protein LOC130727618 isoform X6 [Lotus japonicus]